MSVGSRLVEAFTLRDALRRARARDPEVRRATARARSVARQKIDAADALWANGHAAEGLRMAEDAFRSALAAVDVAAPGQDVVAPVASEPSPLLLEPAPEALAPEPEEVGAEEEAELEVELDGERDGELDAPVDEGVRAPEVPLAPTLRTLDVSERDLRQIAALTSTSVAPAVFDDEVSTAHAQRFRRLLETARNLDEALVDHAYTPAQVQVRRVRRLVVVATVIVLCVVGAIGMARKRAYDATATWMARYYSNRNFQGEPERTFDHDVNFDWGNDSPMRGIPADEFSVRWDVCLRTDEAQTLDVSLGSDDGSRIFVDGEKLIDNWRMQTQTWRHEHVEISPGNHHIRVEYFEGGGAARMQLRLRSGGSPLEGELVRPTSPDDGC